MAIESGRVSCDACKAPLDIPLQVGQQRCPACRATFVVWRDDFGEWHTKIVGAAAKNVSAQVFGIICCRNGHKLRVPSELGTLQVTCPTCRDSFEWSGLPNGNDSNTRRIPSPVVAWTGMVVLALVAAMGVYYIYFRHVEPATIAPDAPRAIALPPVKDEIRVRAESPRLESVRVSSPKYVAVPPPNIPVLVSLPLPANGEIKRWFDGAPLPILKVKIPNDGHRFVKIEDWVTKAPVATVFIRSGDEVTVNLPSGSYRIKVAAGKDWFGEGHLFGPTTSCAVLSDSFEFNVTTYGNRQSFTECEVKLIKQAHGNLESKPLNIEEF